MNGPGRPDRGWDGGQDRDPAFRPDNDEDEKTPRRARQPVLTVLAIIAILVLIAAVGIFGGIF